MIDDEYECFLCGEEFKEGDRMVEFFGGFAHFDCFDKQMRENAKRREEESSNISTGSD